MSKPETMMIDEVKYIREDSIKSNQLADTVDGLRYCMVRTYSAGVFAGYVKERSGQGATVLKARRIWKWEGAASLSQLATDGTSKPGECKFPCEVEEVILTNVVEIIPITVKAQNSISAVAVWSE